MSARRYTEKESAEIMRTAVESQVARDSSPGQGVTEAELRAAARELGIDQAAMDAALMAIDSGPTSGRPRLWSRPTQYEAEAIFEGDLSDEGWEDVLSDLRRTFGEPGAVEQRGGTREWVGAGGGLVTNTVTLRQAGRSVRVKSMADWSGLSVLAHIMLLFPVFVTAGLLSKVAVGQLEAILIAVALIGAYVLGVRYLLGIYAAKRSRQLSQLVRRIEALLATTGMKQTETFLTAEAEQEETQQSELPPLV